MSNTSEYAVAYKAAWKAAQDKITEEMEKAKAEWFTDLDDFGGMPHEAYRDAVEDIYKTICDQHAIGGDVWSKAREAAHEAARATTNKEG